MMELTRILDLLDEAIANADLEQIQKLVNKLRDQESEEEKPQLRLSELVQTCSACPSQWDAIDANTKFPVYIRFRWGHLSVERALTPDGNPFDGETIYSEQISDGLDGYISEEDMLKKIGAVKV